VGGISTRRTNALADGFSDFIVIRAVGFGGVVHLGASEGCSFAVGGSPDPDGASAFAWTELSNPVIHFKAVGLVPLTISARARDESFAVREVYVDRRIKRC
jgi:hypothetical protein